MLMGRKTTIYVVFRPINMGSSTSATEESDRRRGRPDPGRAGTGLVLRRDGVAAAILGASRPKQVHANAAAAGKELSADILAAIDEALGDAPQKEPILAPLAEVGVKHR